MKNASCFALFIALVCAAAHVHAQQDVAPAGPDASSQVEARTSTPASVEQVDIESAGESTDDSAGDRGRDDENDRDRHRHHRVIFGLDRDSKLPAGEAADAIIAIAGSVAADGDVREAAVAIFGAVRVTGRVGESAVAVFGDVSIDGSVEGDVVAVLGDVKLGPAAKVTGDVVAVGGHVIRDPQADARGDIHEVSFPGGSELAVGLGTWFRHCALLARPLALVPNLEWAWGLALGFLALYVVLALLFTRSLEACMHTIETQPGQTALAALLAVFLSPLLMLLLTITIIGAALVPFAWLALLVAGLFGKAAVLAALGRRLTRFIGGPFNHPAVAVLMGGVLVLAAYLVPVLGFIVFGALAMLGLGVVAYTMLLRVKSARDARSATAATAVANETPAPVIVEAPAAVPPVETASAASLAALPRAQFGIRMAALFIDVVLVGVILGALHGDADLTLITLAAYGAVMWKLRGTTIGGILCNLQVVRVDGRDIDWATCIVRALSCFLSLAAAGLGFLWILFNDERQAWHDKIAGTAVVRVAKAAPLV